MLDRTPTKVEACYCGDHCSFAPDLPPGWDRITHPQHGTFDIEYVLVALSLRSDVSFSHEHQLTTRQRPKGQKHHKGQGSYDPLARQCTRKYIYEATSYALNYGSVAEDIDIRSMLAASQQPSVPLKV